MFETLKVRKADRVEDRKSTHKSTVAAPLPGNPAAGAARSPDHTADRDRPKPAGSRSQSIMYPTAQKPTAATGVSQQTAAPSRSVTKLPAQVTRGQTPERKEKLVVGPSIHLKGEITDCDTLVVEGHVEGSAKSRAIRLTNDGDFRGSATVETAEIKGKFEGKLTVSGRLVIRSGGKATGTIRYAAVEIEAGGEIAGDVQLLSEARDCAPRDIDLAS